MELRTHKRLFILRHNIFQLLLLENVGKRHFKPGFVERLGDEVGGTTLHCIYHHVYGTVSSDHNDWEALHV